QLGGGRAGGGAWGAERGGDEAELARLLAHGADVALEPFAVLAALAGEEAAQEQRVGDGGGGDERRVPDGGERAAGAERERRLDREAGRDDGDRRGARLGRGREG